MAIYTNKDIAKTNTRKKTLPIVLICVFSVLLLNLLFNILPFVNSFMLGVFGLTYYVICVCTIVFSALSLANKKINATKKDIVFYSIWLFIFFSILHLATSSGLIEGYGKYLTNCYDHKYTAGGLLLGIFVYPLPYLTHNVGAYVIYSIALVIITTLIIEKFITHKQVNAVAKTKVSETIVEQPDEEVETEEDVVNDRYDNDIFIKDEEPEEKSTPVEVVDKNKEKARVLLGLKKSSEAVEEKPAPIVTNDDDTYSYAKARQAGVSTSEYILTPNTYEEITKGSRKPNKIYHEDDLGLRETPIVTEQTSTPKAKTLSKRDAANLEFLRASTGYYSPLDDEDESSDIYDENLTLKDFNANKQNYINKITAIDEAVEDLSNDDFSIDDNLGEEISFVPVKDIKKQSPQLDVFKKDNFKPQFKNSPYTMEAKDDILVEAKGVEQIKLTEVKSKPAPKPKYRKPSNYIRPPIDLLRVIPSDSMEVTDELQEKGRLLEETLANFKIPAKIISITKGPAFTRYELQLAVGTPVKRVTNYVNDLAMAIQSKGHIRLEIPIPGKNAFGIEVPNESISPVGLREIIDSYNFQKSKSKLTFALGKDITSECKVSAVDKCVHMLVAGSTGSGKSVCLNTMLISLMYKTGPEDLKFILIDPKRVEFAMYAGLPHMLIPKPINDPMKAVDALGWVVKEMERRYTLLSNNHVHNITEYNDLPEVQKGLTEKMYYLVVVVDELNDLMMQARRDVEEKITRIAQLARAAGIHLVIATQRPSVDVITGTIKSNLPTRVAFAVTSFTDSKTILDQAGAEDLLGRGDMLFNPYGSNELLRIQGAYVTNEEIQAVINFIKDNNEAYFDDAIEDEMFNKNNGGFEVGGDSSAQFDPLLKDCLRNAIKTQSVSASKFQRIFGIGWPRAAKIVDQMVAAGFISEPDNKHNYTIFVTEQEFEEKFGEDF